MNKVLSQDEIDGLLSGRAEAMGEKLEISGR